MILNEGLRGLMTSPTPVIVPPVPMPEMTMSTLPSVSFQISSAVVRRWMAGLEGLANCWRMTLFGILVGELLGLGDRALHTLGALGQDEARARGP